jgi:hypothetical protein
MRDEMADEAKKHLPPWAKKLLVIVSIVGPLTGAVVTCVTAFYDVRAKAHEANSKTKASYDTLAPAVKELQELLAKTQDVVDAQEKQLADLRTAKEDDQRRIIRLEAYVEILGRSRTLPAPPPRIESGQAKVSEVKVKHSKPAAPIPDDVKGAYQYQQVKADLGCAPNDPMCELKAAAKAEEAR